MLYCTVYCTPLGTWSRCSASWRSFSAASAFASASSIFSPVTCSVIVLSCLAALASSSLRLRLESANFALKSEIWGEKVKVQSTHETKLSNLSGASSWLGKPQNYVRINVERITEGSDRYSSIHRDHLLVCQPRFLPRCRGDSLEIFHATPGFGEARLLTFAESSELIYPFLRPALLEEQGFPFLYRVWRAGEMAARVQERSIKISSTIKRRLAQYVLLFGYVRDFLTTNGVGDTEAPGTSRGCGCTSHSWPPFEATTEKSRT